MNSNKLPVYIRKLPDGIWQKKVPSAQMPSWREWKDLPPQFKNDIESYKADVMADGEYVVILETI